MGTTKPLTWRANNISAWINEPGELTIALGRSLIGSNRDSFAPAPRSIGRMRLRRLRRVTTLHRAGKMYVERLRDWSLRRV